MTYSDNNPNFDEDFKNFAFDASFISSLSLNMINLKRLGIDSETEDDTVFGADFVYCTSHMRPHTAGWCTVGAARKRPLNAKNLEDALDETEFLLKVSIV